MPAATMAPSEAGPATDRQVARTAALSLRCADLNATAEQLRQLAESMGGYVASESIWTSANTPIGSPKSPSGGSPGAITACAGYWIVGRSSVSGSVWDVIVDLRSGSPTFGRWQALTLTAGDETQVLIPPGVAHGFQALEADTELLYLHTACYAPQAQAGVHCQDGRLAITWPLPVRGLSPRDQGHPPLGADFGRRGQKDFQWGVRQHHRADVTTLHDTGAAAGQVTL